MGLPIRTRFAHSLSYRAGTLLTLSRGKNRSTSTLLADILFDADWYLKNNADVRTAAVNPFTHFCQHGRYEGRSPHPLFDREFYREYYTDVKTECINPVEHYLTYGIAEGRRPNAFFDPKYYRAAHKDNSEAQANPLAHYLVNAREPGNHPSPFFDNDWYIQQYLANEPRAVPLVHFIETGEIEGLRPHPLFDEHRYLKLNHDIAQAVNTGHIRSGFRHFVLNGADDLEAGRYRHFGFNWRNLFLDYDAKAYLADNPDVNQRINEGLFRYGLEHLFAVGWRESMDGLRALYDRRHRVLLLRTVDGCAPRSGGRYLCLFAHYDKDNLVDPYVVSYLEALRRMEVDIVFVTATNDDKQWVEIKPLVVKILVKNEAGRDFGSWWLALRTLGLDCGKGYDRVIFANDSIYFPVRPVEPLFADMAVKKYNLYGLSDSREGDIYHLQSFFLAFDSRAQAAVFPEFVERFERNYVLTKWGQIREYEWGLTEIAQECGLAVGAFFSIDDAREEAIRNLALARWESALRQGLGAANPTHDLWDLLIGYYGWPALKLELLRDNPRKGNGFEFLPRLIADGDVSIKHIEDHQARSKQRETVLVRSSVKGVAPPIVELIERIRGHSDLNADRLVLFAHYDPQAQIDPHIVYQVKALQKAGCAVALTTSVRDPKELSKVRPFVRDILIKTDAGRDFGSWDVAIRTLGDEVKDFGSVIWMNDSTYFPLFDPMLMFTTMEKRGSDFWGIVDSYNVIWHIMSWFWAFGRKVITNGWFDWYAREYDPTYEKWGQIHNYEMRMPRLIRASGLKTDVFVPARDVAQKIIVDYPDHPHLGSARRGDFTMTHTFWREIITDFHCPALKVELVRDNPLGIDLSQLLSVIGERTDYDPDLIRRHMLRLKTPHLPPPSWTDLGRTR